MKLIDKLDMMMSEKSINRKELSEGTGIPYTTISSFYDKGTDNIKLSTLKRLAEYFECSLDFIADDNVTERNANKNYKKIDGPSWEEDPSIIELKKDFEKYYPRISDLSRNEKEKLLKMIDIYLD